MKYLLVLAVVGAFLWLMFGRGRGGGAPPKPRARGAAQPAAMVACRHCGVHLPQSEALTDAAGRPYCSDAHRLAGPN
jgi:uncharacterized protein